MACSCAVVRLAGAKVVLLVAYVTASLARVTKTTPPLPLVGSVAGVRPREDRAKSVQNCLPSLVFRFEVRASGPPLADKIPADEPSGRGSLVQPDLSVIGSRVAPVTGLVASQLYKR